MTPKKHVQRKGNDPSAGQAWAIDELRRIAEERPHELEVVDVAGLGDYDYCWLTLSLPTGQLPRAQGGLRLREHELVQVGIPPSFPLHPPLVQVAHLRFAGHPHVLQGYRLCLYLDPHREWQALDDCGIRFLRRLWEWFEDAAAARHDAAGALYHPVGGVLHWSDDTPTVVIREDFPQRAPILANAYLRQRTDHRIDLHWGGASAAGRPVARVVRLRDPLYFSAGTSLLNLLAVVDRPQLQTTAAKALHQGWPPSGAVLTALARTAQRNEPGTPLYFVVAAPHPNTGVYHLLTGRLPVGVADGLRKACSQMWPSDTLEAEDLPWDAPIEWCAMSDERPEITTRRDARRPVHAFQGKHVHLWGCGGLGSWIAEFVARAGVAEITLSDGAQVGGGLLVRQNYLENDIGHTKAEALARRLRALCDDIVVNVKPGNAPPDDSWLHADLLIDATVNIALAQALESMLRSQPVRPLVAQVATDVATASLGLLVVSTSRDGRGPYGVDRHTTDRVLQDSAMERFHTFWREPAKGEEVVPARGCSVPTFHGSSADLAGVAASLVTFLGLHLETEAPGVHLIALPHAEGGPGHHFIPAPPAEEADQPSASAGLAEFE